MWRFIKWTFLSVVALVILGGAGGIIILNSVDLGEYRQEIAEEVESLTGRKLIIRGKIEKHILTLTPAIVLHDVTFSNAKWSRRPHMIKAKKIRLVVRLIPLLTGNIDIKRFDLIGADILLETNRAEVGNWVLGSDSPRKKTKTRTENKNAGQVGAMGLNPDDVPFIEKVRIVDSSFTFIDGRTGLASRVGMKDVRFDAPSRDAPIKLLIKGDLNGKPVTTQATLGSYESFLRQVEKFPVTLKVTFGSTDIAGALNANLRGKRMSISGALTSARINIDELGSAGSGARAAGKGVRGKRARRSRYMFSPAPLPIGLLRGFDLDLTLQTGVLLVGRNPIKTVSGRITLTGGDLQIRDLKAGVHGGNMAGSLRLNASGAVPKLDINLTVKRIPLRQVTKLLFERAVIASAMNADVNLAGQGRSMRQIASTLDGKVNLVLGPGPVQSSILGILSTNLVGFLNKSGRGRGLAITRGVVNVNFRRGVGATAAVVDTTAMTFCGNGVISTRTEAMNILVVTNPKGLAVTNVAALVPLRIAGPLRRPGVRAETGAVGRQLGRSLLRLGDKVLSGGKGGGGCNRKSKTGRTLKKVPSNILKRLNIFKRR